MSPLIICHVTNFILVLDSVSASKLPRTGRVFVSVDGQYVLIWHLVFLIFTLFSRPDRLKVASSIALTVAPLSGSTVMFTLQIATFVRGLLSEGPTGLTVSIVARGLYVAAVG